MLRDVALFAHSVFHSRLIRPRAYYWDATKEEELDHVVELLSNTDDPERVEIRRVLREEKIARLLDAGCGPATELGGYKKDGLTLRYAGLDGSRRMLGVARSRHPEASFIRGGLERLPFADSAFDGVLLKHVLEHQADYQPVLREAVRVASRVVIVNFFHRPLPGTRDVILRDRRGFWNNWYSRSRFEAFARSLPVQSLTTKRAVGTAGQTAEVYVLRK